MKNIIVLFFMIVSVPFYGKVEVVKKKETRYKIAIVDTGMSFEQSNKDYMCEKSSHRILHTDSIYDGNGHGANIISIISKSVNPKTHCIVMYKYWSDDLDEDLSIHLYTKALSEISNDPLVTHLNLSNQGFGSFYKEKKALERILKKGVIVTVSAGNHSLNLDKECNVYPACYAKTLKYDNLHVVGSNRKFSNKGKIVTNIRDGYEVGKPLRTGTSQSAAQMMADILKRMVVYNQRGN